MVDLGDAQDGPPTPEPVHHVRAGRHARRSRTRQRLLALVLVLALAGFTVSRLPGGARHSAAPAPLPAPSSSAAALPTSAVHPRPPVPSAVVSQASQTAGTPSAPPTVDPQLAATRTASVKAVLARRSAAMMHRDLAGWTATLATSPPGYRKHQLAVFANTRAVPFASYSYDVDADDIAAATVPRVGELLVPVTLHYALRGFDPRPTALREYLTFVTGNGGWRIVSDLDDQANGLRSSRNLWDFGPVVVVRGLRSLILVHPDRIGLARTIAAAADAAVPRVTSFWGTGWSQRVVVLVPDSQGELRRIVDTQQDLSQIAALATAEIGGSAGSAGAVGDRIAINPTTFTTLGSLGRRVVMTHEITHVASRAVTGSGSPTWLVEGLADYVGFKGTSTSLRFDAAELAHRVDGGRLPTALPSSADFAHAGATLSLDYEEAWMACRFIVSRTSEATLIAFYRQVGTAKGTPAEVLEAAFAHVLHTDQATFTASWSSYVGASLR